MNDENEYEMFGKLHIFIEGVWSSLEKKSFEDFKKEFTTTMSKIYESTEAAELRQKLKDTSRPESIIQIKGIPIIVNPNPPPEDTLSRVQDFITICGIKFAVFLYLSHDKNKIEIQSVINPNFPL